MAESAYTSHPALIEFVATLARALGDRLISALEYRPLKGISVAPGNRPRAHVLVLCRAIDAGVIAAIRAPLTLASKSLELTPVVFSRDEFLASLDVFPVEALEIRRTYTLLHGEDVMKAAEVAVGNLRHQLEFELRSKKLYLVSQLLREQESSAEVGRTILAFHEAFFELARYVLYLKGKEVVEDRSQLINLLEADPGTDAQLLRRLGEVAQGRLKLGAEEKAQLVWSFLGAVDLLIEAVDRL